MFVLWLTHQIFRYRWNCWTSLMIFFKCHKWQKWGGQRTEILNFHLPLEGRVTLIYEIFRLPGQWSIKRLFLKFCIDQSPPLHPHYPTSTTTTLNYTPFLLPPLPFPIPNLPPIPLLRSDFFFTSFLISLFFHDLDRLNFLVTSIHMF